MGALLKAWALAQALKGLVTDAELLGATAVFERGRGHPRVCCCDDCDDRVILGLDDDDDR